MKLLFKIPLTKFLIVQHVYYRLFCFTVNPTSIFLKMSFSESLKQDNVDIWNKILNHEFIREMAEGILPKSKFIFYLKQDQIFLKSFCKLLAAASRIAYDKDTKAWFGSLLDSTTRYEMPTQF